MAPSVTIPSINSAEELRQFNADCTQKINAYNNYASRMMDITREDIAMLRELPGTMPAIVARVQEVMPKVTAAQMKATQLLEAMKAAQHAFFHGYNGQANAAASGHNNAPATDNANNAHDNAQDNAHDGDAETETTG